MGERRKQHDLKQRSLKQIDRPIPNQRAKRGLLCVESVEVTFSGGSDRNQEEALDHISELIAFWNMKYLDWTP